MLTAAITAAAGIPAEATAQTLTAADRFSKLCAACHTIGGGRLAGPDLKGIHERRSEEWLLRFVTSPQKMISAGDTIAVRLQKEFTLVMPDPAYSKAELQEILAYIKAGGSGPAVAAAPQRAATPEDIRKGQELFQGIVRLESGGPACNSCHHVRNDAVIGGGVLAKELTSVFGRLGGVGIQGILGKPPFPVMEEAYRDRPLRDDEVFALVSFLQDADRQQAFQQPRDYGFRLVYSGAGGFVVLLAAFWVIGRRRKTHPVNRAIFDRQVRSR
ncbi:MAG: cytochrome c [Gemmatimonadales bacterium]|nr:cytochrome c [Gemmatimonadales bacterium]